jgi:hypothetical protein
VVATVAGLTNRMTPRDMKPRDAIIKFECFSPDLVQVSETIDGERLLHEEVPRHANVVTQMEQRYIFFADEADVARKMVRRGRSCVVSVYFREP